MAKKQPEQGQEQIVEHIPHSFAAPAIETPGGTPGNVDSTYVVPKGEEAYYHYSASAARVLPDGTPETPTTLQKDTPAEYKQNEAYNFQGQKVKVFHNPLLSTKND